MSTPRVDKIDFFCSFMSRAMGLTRVYKAASFLHVLCATCCTLHVTCSTCNMLYKNQDTWTKIFQARWAAERGRLTENKIYRMTSEDSK